MYHFVPTMKSQGAAKNAANNEAQSSAPAQAQTAAVSAPALDLSKVKIEPLFEDMVDFETFSRSDFRAVKIEACEAVPKSKKLLKLEAHDPERYPRVLRAGGAGRKDSDRHYKPSAQEDDGH